MRILQGTTITTRVLPCSRLRSRRLTAFSDSPPQWAKRFAQSPDFDKLNNKGWPGCCRQPRLGEMELIDDADWPVVSKRYGLPDRSTLRDRPQRPVSLSKAAGRSGSSARRGSIDVSVSPRHHSNVDR